MLYVRLVRVRVTRVEPSQLSIRVRLLPLVVDRLVRGRTRSRRRSPAPKRRRGGESTRAAPALSRLVPLEDLPPPRLEGGSSGSGLPGRGNLDSAQRLLVCALARPSNASPGANRVTTRAQVFVAVFLRGGVWLTLFRAPSLHRRGVRMQPPNIEFFRPGLTRYCMAKPTDSLDHESSDASNQLLTAPAAVSAGTPAWPLASASTWATIVSRAAKVAIIAASRSRRSATSGLGRRAGGRHDDATRDGGGN